MASNILLLACLSPTRIVIGYLLKYAASLMLNRVSEGMVLAARSGDAAQGMEVFLPDDPHSHFVYMGLNI